MTDVNNRNILIYWFIDRCSLSSIEQFSVIFRTCQIIYIYILSRIIWGSQSGLSKFMKQHTCFHCWFFQFQHFGLVNFYFHYVTHQYINIMINQVPENSNRMMYTSMVYIWYNSALQGAIFLPNTLKVNYWKGNISQSKW
jgi:hypothetical protein